MIPKLHEQLKVFDCCGSAIFPIFQAYPCRQRYPEGGIPEDFLSFHHFLIGNGKNWAGTEELSKDGSSEEQALPVRSRGDSRTFYPAEPAALFLGTPGIHKL